MKWKFSKFLWYKSVWKFSDKNRVLSFVRGCPPLFSFDLIPRVFNFLWSDNLRNFLMTFSRFEIMVHTCDFPIFKIFENSKWKNVQFKKFRKINNKTFHIEWNDQITRKLIKYFIFFFKMVAAKSSLLFPPAIYIWIRLFKKPFVLRALLS